MDSNISNDDLLAEVARRFPDRVLLPRDPSRLMCMRGYQGRHVFEAIDYAGDYLSYEHFPHIKDISEGDRYDSTDERFWFLIAAIYRGCLEGYEEWEERRQEEGETKMYTSWNVPVTPPKPEDLTWEPRPATVKQLTVLGKFLNWISK